MESGCAQGDGEEAEEAQEEVVFMFEPNVFAGGALGHRKETREGRGGRKIENTADDRTREREQHKLMN